MGIKLKPIYSRFRSFGGMQLMREYFRMGLFPTILKRTIQTVIHGRSLESVVYSTYNDIDKFLYKRYHSLMLQLVNKYDNRERGGQNHPTRYGFAGCKGLRMLLL